jgi:DNA-binding NarL/FixJ family response regulator
MADQGTVLIVDDDEAFARIVVAPPFSRRWHLEFAFNVPQAHESLEHLTDLKMAIVDLDLPGGQPFGPSLPGGFGFDVASRIRAVAPQCWVVILTGHLLPHLVNQAHRLGAEFLHKENCLENLSMLAERLHSRGHPSDERAAEFLDYLQWRFSLSPRQVEIASLAIRGLENAEIAQQLGITCNTLKRHVRLLLSKCGAPTLRALARTYYSQGEAANGAADETVSHN